MYFDIRSIGDRYGKFVGAVDSQGEPGKCFYVERCLAEQCKLTLNHRLCSLDIRTYVHFTNEKCPAWFLQAAQINET